jgi:hypothetical protein
MSKPNKRSRWWETHRDFLVVPSALCEYKSSQERKNFPFHLWPRSWSRPQIGHAEHKSDETRKWRSRARVVPPPRPVYMRACVSSLPHSILSGVIVVCAALPHIQLALGRATGTCIYTFCNRRSIKWGTETSDCALVHTEDLVFSLLSLRVCIFQGWV